MRVFMVGLLIMYEYGASYCGFVRRKLRIISRV